MVLCVFSVCSRLFLKSAVSHRVLFAPSAVSLRLLVLSLDLVGGALCRRYGTGNFHHSTAESRCSAISTGTCGPISI